MIIERHPVDAGIMNKSAGREVRRFGSLGSVSLLIWLRILQVRQPSSLFALCLLRTVWHSRHHCPLGTGHHGYSNT